MDQQVEHRSDICQSIIGPGWKALLAASMSIMISACADLDSLERQTEREQQVPAGATDFDQGRRISILCFRFDLTTEEFRWAMEES